jgi:hypothetical protein
VNNSETQETLGTKQRAQTNTTQKHQVTMKPGYITNRIYNLGTGGKHEIFPQCLSQLFYLKLSIKSVSMVRICFFQNKK